MSVRGRNGKWVVDYYPSGQKGKRRRITLPASIASREEAEAIERNLRNLSPPTNIPFTNDSSTVNSIFLVYLDWYEIHRAKTTHKDIIGVFKNHISRHLGRFSAEEITLGHIDAYKRLRKSEKVGNRTINKELHYFSGFLRWCAKEGYIKRKQFKIERLPCNRPIPIVLSTGEVVRLLDAAEPFYRAFFLCLYLLGLRFSEAKNLKWKDIDYENQLLRIRQKGGKYKILPASPILLASFEVIREENPAGNVFLSKRTGRPIVDVRKAIKRAAKKAGITKHVYPHLLRHSVATHLLEKNINLRTIQQVLGHADIGTTEFYTHVVLGTLREAESAISGGLQQCDIGGDWQKGF